MRTFQAVLFIVGKPSSRAVRGSRSHRIRLTGGAVGLALEHLPGTPLWRSQCLTTHDNENQIGTIRRAFIAGDMFCIEGDVFDSHAIDLAACAEPLGVSFDALSCHVEDMRADVWKITEAIFIGVNVLFQRIAGHGDNCLFWLEATDAH